MLVEFPRVERVVQRVHRVRPPHGFALAQDRQQARKVHLLHAMLKVRLRNRAPRRRRRARLLTSPFYLWSELPGLHALPAGGSPPQLLRLCQRHARPDAANSAAAGAAHAGVPQHQQVHARKTPTPWLSLNSESAARYLADGSLVKHTCLNSEASASHAPPIGHS